MGNSAHSRVAKDASSDVSPKSSQNKSPSEGEQDVPKGNGVDGATENGPKSKAFEMELTVKPDPLTEKQMAMLQVNWKELEDNIAKVGVITFISLFETHPDVQEVFIPFKGIELDELRHSKQLKAHALRVMAFVQKAVARLYEPDKLDVLLRELGKKHYSYGAKQQYIDYIAPQFIQAIKPSLQDRWTDELEEAWIALFNYMGAIMKAAMDWEEKRAAAATIPYVLPTSAAPKSPPPAANASNSTPSEASRRASSDVVGGGGTTKTENLRRGTLN